VGSRVVVELVTATGETERLAFDIVAGSEAEFEAGFLGVDTPLAQAIVGQPQGSRVSYTAADIIEVRIVSVTASSRAPMGDAEAKRESVMRKAASKSNLADAQRLALTVDSKWGDYDPEGIQADWEQD
jgi:hypothetical protein